MTSGMSPAAKLRKSAPVWLHNLPPSTMSLQERPPHDSEQSPRSTLRSSSANPRPPNTFNNTDSLERDMATPGDRSSLPLLPRTSAQTEGRPRSNSLEYLPQSTTMGLLSAFGSRPSTANPEHDIDRNKSSRLSVFGMGLFPRSRNSPEDISQTPDTPAAWLLCTENENAENLLVYSVDNLITGRMIEELNLPNSEILVHLFPRSNQRGPSIKVPCPVLYSSRYFCALIRGGLEESLERTVDGSQQAANVQVGPSRSPDGVEQFTSAGKSGVHIFVPLQLSSDATAFTLTDSDVQALIDVRNLFAFLTSKRLVATKRCPTLFRILMGVSLLLQKFEFRNEDGSTYGEAAELGFSSLVEEFKLDDVRESRLKTIQAIILAERMKCPELYKEVFPHAVGNYISIKAAHPGAYGEISESVRERLHRAHLDLTQRQNTVNMHLSTFNFPSLFAGIASSTTIAESKVVRFSKWKLHCSAMRTFILEYYRDLYGQWPPKAKNKQIKFVSGGLNRLVLRGLYRDLCFLYDSMADREAFTTRHMNSTDNYDDDSTSMNARGLRKLLEEYDRSSPPVLPPIPFDLPLEPKMTSIDGKHDERPQVEQQKAFTRALKDHEVELVLLKSHEMIGHMVSDVPQNPILKAYQQFEVKEGRGKSCQELVDQRYGHWIMLYAILQLLPLLVVDVDGLNYTDGVEYFLCQAPIGALPWVAEGTSQRELYAVQSSDKLISMPKDVVKFSIEATYQRSHCWRVAEEWLQPTSFEPPQLEEPQPLSPLVPPPGFADGLWGVRPSARNMGRRHESMSILRSDNVSFEEARRSKRMSIGLGLSPVGRLDAPTGFRHSSSTTPITHGSNTSSPDASYFNFSPAAEQLASLNYPGSSAPSSGPPSRPGTGKAPAKDFKAILESFEAERKEEERRVAEEKRVAEQKTRGSWLGNFF